MTVLLALVGLIAAVNAPRVRGVLDQDLRSERVAVAGLGAAVALLGVALAALVADAMLDPFDLSIETARIGVGVVVLLVGARDLVATLPEARPALVGRRAALVPVAFPLLVNPALIFLAWGAALDHAATTSVLLAIPALAPVPLLAIVSIGSPTRRRALAGAARLTAALLVLVGVALAADGVFDI